MVTAVLSYNPVELDAEIAKLKQEVTFYTAQNIGDNARHKARPDLDRVQDGLKKIRV